MADNKAAFLQPKHAKRLKDLQRRVRDMYASSKTAIMQNRVAPVGLGLIADLRFCLAIIQAQQERFQVDVSEVRLPDDGAENDFSDGYNHPIGEDS